MPVRRTGLDFAFVGLVVLAGCLGEPMDPTIDMAAETAHDRSAAVTGLEVLPDAIPVAVGAFQQFTATDQNGLAVPGVAWSVDGGGTIDRHGVFTATSPGRFVVRARHARLTDEAAVRVVDAGAGLVAHWDMDAGSVAGSTVEDRAGEGNDGVIVGAAPAEGVSGQALAFDGEDDHVRVADAPSLRPGELTIAAWVRPEASANHAIVNKRRSGFLDSYTLRLAGGAPEVCLEPAAAQRCLKAVNSFVPQGEWSHVAATWDGSTIRLFRNGTPDPATAAHAAAAEYGDFPVLLGAEDQNGTQDLFFQGRLDDVRVYRRALDGDEIRALYRAPLQDSTRRNGHDPDAPPGECSGPGALEGCDVGGLDHPNEPEGFRRVAEHDLACVPGDATCPAAAGEWWNDGSPHLSLVPGRTRSGALESVLRIRFPAGLDDGGEPARFDGWGPSIDHGGENDHDEIYVSFWMKIEGSSFENQTVGTKVFYVAYGSAGRLNHSGFQLRGFGRQEPLAEMPLHLFISEMNPDGTDPGGEAVFHAPNVADVPFTVGEWHRIELWMKANDVGPTLANGEAKWWLDGTLLAHHAGKRFRSDLNPRGFYHLQVTPVYGGNSGDVRTRDDHWLVEHVYVSAPRP